MAVKQTVAQQIAERLASHEHVERAQSNGHRIVVDFPRSRGGRAYLTLPEAKRLAERLGV